MSASLLVTFASERELLDALGTLRAKRLGDIEIYTPKPIETGYSIVPTLVLIAGILGTVASFALQTYADTAAYPLDIGGRPDLSWPAFIPIAFENGVLVAVLVGFFAFFAVNHMPRLYDAIDETIGIRRATRDSWCLAIRTEVPESVRRLLGDFAPEMIEELP